jgi:hypothetical protein
MYTAVAETPTELKKIRNFRNSNMRHLKMWMLKSAFHLTNLFWRQKSRVWISKYILKIPVIYRAANYE